MCLARHTNVSKNEIVHYVSREKSRSWFPQVGSLPERVKQSENFSLELHIVLYSHLNCGHFIEYFNKCYM